MEYMESAQTGICQAISIFEDRFDFCEHIITGVKTNNNKYTFDESLNMFTVQITGPVPTLDWEEYESKHSEVLEIAKKENIQADIISFGPETLTYRLSLHSRFMGVNR